MGQHANIVPVRLFENILHQEFKRNIPFVFSEYMPRGSIREYLKEKRRLDLKESLSLGIQLCSGLMHAYEYGLTAHLDLKPDNIMVHADGMFQVTDFSSGVAGTPGYMAPEQVRIHWKSRGVDFSSAGEPIDQRADQFAVALVMLESFLGHHPFSICRDACYQQDRARQFMAEGIGDLGLLMTPGGLRGILVRALSTDADKRYEGVETLRSELVGMYEKEFGRYVPPEVKRDNSAQYWFDRGCAFEQLGRETFAESSYKEALNRFHDLPGTEFNQALCERKLGVICESMGRYRESEDGFQRALVLYRRIPDTEVSQASCKRGLGIAYWRTHRYGEAEESLKQAVAVYQGNPGMEVSQAGCAMNLGNLYWSIGRYNDAEESFQQALTIYRGVPGTEVSQATCTKNLGNVYWSISRYDDAEGCYKEAIAVYRRIPGTEVPQASCITNLAVTYERTGRYEEAERCFKDAIAVYRGVSGTQLGQAHCTMNLGNVYADRGRYKEAEPFYQQALAVFREFPGEELDYALCTMNLGNVCKHTDRREEAQSNYRQALAIFQRLLRGKS